MNPLIGRVFELPPRQRVMLVVGAVLVVFLLYAQFLYWPRGTLITEKAMQRDQLHQERDRKAALVANLEKTRREVAQLDGDLKMAAAQLPTTKEIPDLLSN